MINFVKSELLKQRHSFNRMLLWLAPILTLLLALAMMGGSNLQNGAYNWWYTVLLPGSFTIFSAFTIARERKKNRHGLFGVVVQKSRLWLAQIIVGILFLLVSCIIFFVGGTFLGFLFGETINWMSCLTGSLLLVITFAWQIPLWMCVTELMGTVTTILLSMVCNSGIAVICAAESYWWIPFSIPARLMCPIIGVLPNGLWVEAGSPMEHSNVILPGIMITAALLMVFTIVTTLWFQKREV
ncbi:MAG: lantibiotic immunity ABC transporter MutE/EpiE family permease subunit [Lachnospiraceae bacterium]